MQTNDEIQIEVMETKDGAIRGWRVALEVVGEFTIVQTITVLAEELPVPAYVTRHQIIHVARVKSAAPRPPKRLKKSRVKRAKWTTAHDRCMAAAQLNSVDVDAVVDALPAAIESLTDEWQATEPVKRDAHTLTGLSVRDVERIADRYLDHDSIIGFDVVAQNLAYSRPELNWDPSDDNSGRLWELLQLPLARRPRRFDSETIQRAAEFATGRARGEIIFGEWSDDDSIDSETVPF